MQDSGTVSLLQYEAFHFSSIHFHFHFHFHLELHVECEDTNVNVSLRQSSLGSKFDIHGFIFPKK